MEDFSDDIEKCLKVLSEGGVILYPTDTIWGLGCDATNEKAIAKIYQLKKRAESKSMIVLLADERDLIQYVAAPDPLVFDFLAGAIRPTTVIYDGAIGLAANLVAENGSIAIRITLDPFCKHLLRRFRKPIVSTSANISGDPSPKNFQEINPELRQLANYVVQYRQSDFSEHEASSIVRWKNGRAEVIR